MLVCIMTFVRPDFFHLSGFPLIIFTLSYTFLCIDTLTVHIRATLLLFPDLDPYPSPPTVTHISSGFEI